MLAQRRRQKLRSLDAEFAWEAPVLHAASRFERIAMEEEQLHELIWFDRLVL
jgi:hypothetical protein